MMTINKSYEIIAPEDGLTGSRVIILLYGRPGIGKTSLAFTADRPMLLDFDGGVGRAVKRKLAVKFSNWQGVKDLLADGQLSMIRGGTLIIDTVKSMLDDFIGAHIITADTKNGRRDGQLSQAGFGVMKSVFSAFIAETNKYDLDLVFIAHAANSKDDADNTILIPAMTGGSYDTLITRADLIGFMETRNNALVVEFSPTDRHIGKNSPEFPVLEIPHYANPDFDGYLGRLIAETKERRLRKTKEQEVAIAQSEALRKEIETAVSIVALKESLLPRIALLPASYQASVAHSFVERYTAIFAEVHLGPAESPEALTSLAMALSNVPQLVGSLQLRKMCRTLLVDKAKAGSMEWSKDQQRYCIIDKQASA